MANQNCVVDGRVSNRTWNKTITLGATTYVACDFHSDAAIRDAANAIAAGTANSISPSAPVCFSKNYSKNLHEGAG